MRSGTIAFLLGVLFLQQFIALPDSNWVWLLVVSLPLSLLIKYPFNLPGWFFSGFFWTLLFAQSVLSTGISPQYEGKNILIQGQIASLPLKHERRVQFELDVHQASLDGEVIPHPGKIRLSWYGQENRVLLPGETWSFLVRLKRPTGLMNPGGFDYEAWLFQHRIRATGYVRKSVLNQKSSEAHGYPVQRWRYGLKNHIEKAAGENPALGLFLALVIGDKSGITGKQWQGLQLTGTSHLMAISGLHIGLVAGMAFFLGQFLWRQTGRGMLMIAAPRVAAICAMLAALAYTALAGFAIPTQRALIMVVVVMYAILRAQPSDPSRVLAHALLLVLLFDPLSVLSVSFWLSFAAVVIIFYSASGRLVALPKWRQGVQIQLWLSLGMFPLVLFWFQQVSLISPLVNLIVVPLVGLVVVPLALLATLLTVISSTIGSIVLQIPLILLNGFEWLITTMLQWSWLRWHASTGLLEICLASIGLLVLLTPRGFPGKYIGLILLVPIFLGQKADLADNSARFSLLDVGQGLSAVVQTANHTLVFDTGVRLSPRFDMGNAVVVPFLRHHGIKQIDTLIISHADNDHRGGLDSIWKQIPVKKVITSVPGLIHLHAKPAPCFRGEQWQWDGVKFEILHPAKNDLLKGNNASCVLKVTAGDKSVLLTGDIEKPAEKQLLNTMGKRLDVDILVAAHHGSNTSSKEEFIDVATPQFVLFPVGYRNRYRFPAQPVIQRFSRAGIKQLRTDSSGEISFLLEKSSDLQPEKYRKLARHYWHRQ